MMTKSMIAGRLNSITERLIILIKAQDVGDYDEFNLVPISTQRCFDVHVTSITFNERPNDVLC